MEINQKKKRNQKEKLLTEGKGNSNRKIKNSIFNQKKNKKITD